MKIGVFDSGKGGLFVAQAIRDALTNNEVIFKSDSEHVPYGSRSSEDILALVSPIFQQLIDDDCQIIVVACNTVSTTLIQELRNRFSVPLIAFEPMVKPAAQLTKTKIIAVCATPATLKSQRYEWLKDEYANGVKVLEPDCSEWAQMIEHDNVNFDEIRQTIDSVTAQGADVIVLGCTHYHWIEQEIKNMTNGRAQVIQPVQPVIEQLKRVIAQLP